MSVRFIALTFLVACGSSSPHAAVSSPPRGDFAIVHVVERAGGGFVAETLDGARRVHVRGALELDDLLVAELQPSGVRRIVPVEDMAEARRVVAQLQAMGLADTVVLRAYQGPETLAIARVVDVRGTRLVVEPIRGEVPIAIDVPYHAAYVPMIGERLVVASAHAEPTRLLVTANLAEATRWLDVIERDGWPPIATLVPEADR